MNRGQVAAAVRKNKEKYPERYCPVKNCLWSIARGSTCSKHGVKAHGTGQPVLQIPESVELDRGDFGFFTGVSADFEGSGLFCPMGPDEDE